MVRYEAGGYQRHHLDGYYDEKLGGTARHVTALTYLNDVPEGRGGATQFPYAPSDDDPAFVFDTESCSQGQVVPPSRGDMLIFYNAIEVAEGAAMGVAMGAAEGAAEGAAIDVAEGSDGPSGWSEASAVRYALDERARHAACPLAEGEKLIANLWLHPRPVDQAMLKCARLEGGRHAACMARETRAR